MNRTINGFVKDHFSKVILGYIVTNEGSGWKPEYYIKLSNAELRVRSKSFYNGHRNWKILEFCDGDSFLERRCSSWRDYEVAGLPGYVKVKEKEYPEGILP